AVEIPERLDERNVVVGRHEEHWELLAPGLDERGRLLRRRLVERGLVHDGQRPLRGVRAERSAERRAIRLAVHLHGVAARLWREGDAAPGPLRRAGRARTRAAGALLAPRLPAAAGDEPAALGRLRPGAPRVQLGANGLVDEVRLHVGAEDALVERGLA